MLVNGKAVEMRRDHAMRKDRYFDYGMALLQIAIMLASISIITGATSLLVLSVLISAAGTLSMLTDFTLLVYAVLSIGWPSSPLLAEGPAGSTTALRSNG